MQQLTHESLIKEFFEKVVKDKYPQIDESMCMDICKAPFLFIRKKISEGMLIPDILVKYLGKFKMTLQRVQNLKVVNYKRLQNNTYTLEQYDKLNDFLVQRRKDIIAELKRRKLKNSEDE